MDLVAKYADFVNEQVRLQERLSRRYLGTPWRQQLHDKTGQTFKALAGDLLAVQEQLNKTIHQDVKPSNILRNITLSAEDIEGLPSALMEELNISEADKLEFTIVGLINDAGDLLEMPAPSPFAHQLIGSALL